MTKYNHILITGASSGIGEALAIHYAKNKGCHMLSLCGRNAERLNAVAEKCRVEGVEVEAKILDITDAKATENWIKDTHKHHPLNLVFANAGVATTQETSENIRRTFETNVMGVVNTVLPVLDLFKQNPQQENRHIVILGSIAGYHGLPACPSYSASKAGVITWGKALRLRHKKDGIKISVVCPGFVRSRITDKNTCPMPFFMEADKAAEIIATRVEKNVGLIAFPWQMRFATWLGSILPNRLSDFIYEHLNQT